MNQKTQTLKTLTLQKICEYDNLNQNQLMQGEINKEAYDFNKKIIHSLYNNYEYVDKVDYKDYLNVLNVLTNNLLIVEE